MRQPREPKGPDLTGKAVLYRSRPEEPPERGIVKRMATGKTPCCFVQFPNDLDAKLCYHSQLEIIE